MQAEYRTVTPSESDDHYHSIAAECRSPLGKCQGGGDLSLRGWAVFSRIVKKQLPRFSYRAIFAILIIPRDYELELYVYQIAPISWVGYLCLDWLRHKNRRSPRQLVLRSRVLLSG